MTPQEERRYFYETLATHQWTLAQTIKEMRKITKLTQTEFAKKLGIAPRIIIDIERSKGNPTLKTLQKIGKLFGLELGFVSLNKIS